MMNRLFWIFCAALIAAAIHFAYVLFVPGMEMNRIMESFAAKNGRNDLTLLGPEEARALLSSNLPEMVTAACAFDAVDEPITIDAIIPDSYWMISVYGANGALLFTLDDRQAGVDRMRFVLKPPGQAAEQPEADTITVETPDGSGLVLLQARAEEPAYGPRLRQAMAVSSCGPRQAPGEP